LDGAQAVPHMAVDVQALDCDFYVFSAHKMYGPTGVGVLYGKRDLLSQMPPYQGGGDMIRTVSFEQTTFNDLPYRFEAGTPNIAAVIGLGAAIGFMHDIGIDNIAAHEKDLLQKAMAMLSDIKACRVLGHAKHKAAVISYVWDGVHAHDIGTILDQQGVAVRVGHHCAMPIMQFYGVPATTRASFAVYNSESDVERWIVAMHRVQEVFA
jgi:cysteine desulfurase / selenocysteine lyase